MVLSANTNPLPHNKCLPEPLAAGRLHPNRSSNFLSATRHSSSPLYALTAHICPIELLGRSQMPLIKPISSSSQKHRIPPKPNACADSINSLKPHHDHDRYSSLCAPVYPSTARPLAFALFVFTCIMATSHRISSFNLDYIPPPMRDITLLAATSESGRDMGYSTTSSRCNSIIGSLLIPSLLSGFALLHHGPELEAYE